MHFPTLKEGKQLAEKENHLENIVRFPWLSLKTIWIGTSKDHSFAENCKSVAG